VSAIGITLRWPAIAIVWVAAVQCGLAADGIRIVENGTPRATVVFPNGADNQTRAAAEMLADYVRRSAGVPLPVAQEKDVAAAATPITIHVGRNEYLGGLDLSLAGLDDDGFVIRAVDSQNLVIAGTTPWGTEFGVCEFLERYLGVRWLMPGPDGTDVPQHETIDLPAEIDVRREPTFFSRQFSGLVGATQLTWARRNRMHGRVDFHHNLQRLFPPETYAKTHPEFFPERDGKRYLPPTNNTHGWQPCFSADGIVAEAIANICRYFEQHPDVVSYSLGVIDSSGHCQCQACRAQDPVEPSFLGRRNVSDRYYAWCNRVVEGVLKKHPDKFFGCLAYSEVAEPPTRIKVHPRIIPYMTYDRMKWIDPELRAEGERMTERWHHASPVVGWYDYIYGTPYCVPRVWFHHMAEYYRFAQAHGVRAMYAEAYPNWGEGPKLYVALKLLWNPDADVDELLRDWYLRAVGPAAADDLAAYFALWEDFWTRRILDSSWFTKGGQYLSFYDPSYLADVTEEDVTRSRQLLENVVRQAKTDQQKARAYLLQRAFAYYEASALAYSDKHLGDSSTIRTEEDALQALDRGLVRLGMSRQRKRLVMEEFARHPVLVHPLDLKRHPLLSGGGWGADSFWPLLDWARRSERVRARLEDLSETGPHDARLLAKSMRLLANDQTQILSANPSFEDAAGHWPRQWSQWVKWGIGKKWVDGKAARTGKLGVVCGGMKRGGPHQTLAVEPGYYAAAAYFRVPETPTGAATITIEMTPLDDSGANLPAFSHEVRATARQWTPIAVAGQIPAEIGGKPVQRVRLIVIVNGFAAGEEVYLDDLAMVRVE
jgi:uncharacterized protein DUF4838